MLAKSVPLTRRFRLFLRSWLAVAVALLLIKAALSVTGRQSVTLTAYTLITHFLVLILAAGIATLNAVQSSEAIRLFWSFLAMAFWAWSLSAWTWIYYVLVLGRDRPPSLGPGVPLVLHIVFIIAAVASRPHLKLSPQRAYRTTLNFLLLLFFWVFAYAFLWVPHWYTDWNVGFLLRGQALYLAENVLLFVVLGVLIVRAQSPWKSIYWHLLGASVLYILGSSIANYLLAYRGVYLGLKDIPYMAAACWFVWVALQGREMALQLVQSVQSDTNDTNDTNYASLLAMLSVVAVPVVGVWELFRVDEPYRTRVIRLLIVLLTVLSLSVFVFVKEYLANLELSSDVGLANERLRLAVESGKSVGWEWDVKSGRDLWFGDLRTMFGIPSDTYAAQVQEFYDYVHPEDRQRVSQAVADARDKQKPYRAEFRILWPDGTVRWVAARGRFYYATNGDPERMLGMAVDITDRKQMEETLHESQDRLTGIVASAMDAIVAVNDEQRVVLFNTSAEKMFGCPADDAIGSSIERFIPQRFRAEHSAHIRCFGETGVTNRAMGTLGALWALRSNGKEFPIEASISQIEAGGKKLFTVIIRDVTERWQAEEAVRESEKRFRLVADTTPALIWMSDTDKLCTYFNKPWLDFTGRPMDSELGNGWAEGVHPEDLRKCLDTYAQAFDRRQKFKMEYRLRRHDGEYRWIFDIGVPRFNQERSFVGYIGSCVDVTDRKLAEEALSGVSRKLIEAQEQERTRIGRELHDDIGQRLAMLAVELQQLREDPPDLPQVRSRMGELQKQTSEIADDIQSLSHELHSAKLQYLGIAAAMRGFCKEFGEQQKVEIDFQTHDLPSPVPPDISLCLFRVLQEALHNSAKHSGVRHFEVQLWGTSDEIHLTVRDSGAGFDREAARKSRGLGLISMEERLKLLNGTFSIESQPNRGSTIHAGVPLRSGSDSMRAAG
jgi:PAS domain S-box-containing protein